MALLVSHPAVDDACCSEISIFFLFSFGKKVHIFSSIGHYYMFKYLYRLAYNSEGLVIICASYDKLLSAILAMITIQQLQVMQPKNKSHFLLLFYLCLNLNRLRRSDSVGSFLFLSPQNHVEPKNHQH